MMRTRYLAAAATTVITLVASSVHADPRPDGAGIVRVLGARAQRALAPTANQIGALVAIPSGVTALSLGVDEISPGIGRLRASAAGIVAFAAAHPDVHLEVAPPLRPLMNVAGVTTHAIVGRAMENVDGKGALVGLADTGIDVTHADLRDSSGHSRVAWLLDLSLPPAGKHPDLEQKYGIKDSTGALQQGAVLDAADIDALIASNGNLPQDEEGHGTLVSSIAAGNGGLGANAIYVGIAPSAQIVFARVTRDSTGSINDDDLLDGVQFIFDQAAAMNLPIAVNVSLGSDFGPHDGTLLWEQALAAFVGPTEPGRALVVAAGNSGSISEEPIHQNVYVAKGSDTRVELISGGADDGSVQIWVAYHGPAKIQVGLDGPDGEWIPFVEDGQENAKNTSDYNAGVINGSSASGSQVPTNSYGAVVVWSGKFPAGTYAVKLRGEGTVDLFMQGLGDASEDAASPTFFANGVRETTLTLPATNASLIAVGATINRPNWTSIDKGKVELDVPLLDSFGQMIDPSMGTRPLVAGEIAWFSSAGPNLNGVPKPEISAPGALVIGALSREAVPPSASSIFTNPDCPAVALGGASDPKCFQIDATHAINIGTSFASPMVAGAIALMLEKDPTLTQDKIVALLQAGAHPLRVPSPFEDWAGPGELDVLGSLQAIDQMNDPTLVLPSKAQSWLTLGADEVAADGLTPLTAIVELRAANGTTRADMFASGRLAGYVSFDGARAGPLSPVRRAPGLWSFDVTAPPGHGGSMMTIGVTFDGVDIVTPKSIPIATSVWSADYVTTARGDGCGITRASSGGASVTAIALGLALVLMRRRRRA